MIVEKERILFLDLEAGESGIFGLGAIFGDRKPLRARNAQTVRELLPTLKNWAENAQYVCGHNALLHDFPILEEAGFGPVPAEKALDTLLLSPLAFPKKPYHALVKDGKLVSFAKNDPLADSRCCAEALTDCIDEFSKIGDSDREVYQLAFAAAGLPGISTLLGDCGERQDSRPPNFRNFEDASHAYLRLFTDLNRHRCCVNLLPEFADGDDFLAFAYIHSWLNVSGSDSVLPYWLCHRFPPIRGYLNRIRSMNCGASDCPYCAEQHSPTKALKRFFNFDAYRAVPAVPGEPDQSLQERIVSTAMSGKSMLAILPTGGGKSVCFQVPALHRYDCTGALAIVISPLQSLMKDQVQNLRSRAGVLHCNALYGLLTPLERKACLEDIKLGSIGLLYIAPEQLRSPAFRDAIRNREIAFWIYDEAHCLSKWGHDFRPDYLYAAKFIRELARDQGVDPPEILALTATAKKDVKDDIVQHFKDELDAEVELLDGGTDRQNLSYTVERVGSAAKHNRIHEILSEYYGEQPDYQDKGSAVIFAATRRNVMEIAENLNLRGWRAGAFHAGLEVEEKKSTLEAFLNSELKIIVATNAFGMGVDKPDIRVVIHADAPGSLENYLQEAGRGGRDGEAAECILLFDESDLETQHSFVSYSKISKKDVQLIWKAIRSAKRDENGAIVLSVDEILADERAATVSFDGDHAGARKTKTHTAVALLERQGFLERKENRSRVFQARALVPDLNAAREKILGLNLPLDQNRLWMAIMRVFFELPDNACADVNEFAGLEEIQNEFERQKQRDGHVKSVNTVLFRVLNAMAKAEVGLLRKDLLFTAFLKSGNANPVKALRRLSSLEEEFLKLAQTEEPDAEGLCVLNMPKVNEALCRLGYPSHIDTLGRIVYALQNDWSRLQRGVFGIEVRQRSRDRYHLRIRTGWTEILELSRKRRDLAALVVEHLAPKAEQTTDGLVSFSESELIERAQEDLTGTFRSFPDLAEALHHVLLWLHEGKVIDLQQGKALITSAMTLYLKEHKKGNRARLFTKGDYAPLEIHYVEKILQVHIIGEYARRGIHEVGKHLHFIKEYFRLGGDRFIQLYFSGKENLLKHATGIGSYKKIYESLGNPRQQAIVGAFEQSNALILAGPGSGKTRAVAHRCAWLLRVNRVRPDGIVILCFNRYAALQLRRRIWQLVGKDAAGVTIQTFHGLALRMLGRTMTGLESGSSEGALSFDQLIPEAIKMLKSDDVPIGMDADEFRVRIVGNLTHILVDEYQDIGPEAYELVSLLAGKARESEEERLSIMVVGDDDQSIYGFAGANVEFIRRFEKDYSTPTKGGGGYGAFMQRHYLVENYRSTKNIIDVTNRLISHNRDRMKGEHPIRINASREKEDAGGVWDKLDPVATGCVQIIKVEDRLSQAEACVAEIQRLKSLDVDLNWNQICVFARNNADLVLLRLLLERIDVPVYVLGEESMPNLARAREVYGWLKFMSIQRDGFWAGEQLLEELRNHLGPKVMALPRGVMLLDIASEFYGETGGSEQRVADIAEFFYEALAERKRSGLAEGVVLSTAHKAKGLEFNHVIVLDGNWTFHGKARRDVEEERRVFYVAMTRAKETLAVFSRRDCANRFVQEIKGPGTINRSVFTEHLGADLLGIECRTITLDEVWIDFAARFHDHDTRLEALQSLEDGDPVELHACRTSDGVDRIEVKNRTSMTVGCLSRRGVSNWMPRIETVVRAHVVGMHIRKASDGDGERNGHSPLREEWEIPIVEVYFKRVAPSTVSTRPSHTKG